MTSIEATLYAILYAYAALGFGYIIHKISRRDKLDLENLEQ